MILFFYIILNLIAMFLFIKKKKKLHILEIFVYWMVASYLYQNFSALCYMNFKNLFVPEKLSYELSHFINRIFLFPIIMVTFLHCYHFFSSLIKKLSVIVSFIFILSGLEWLCDYLGVLIHINWQIWWSFSFWIIALFILIGTMKIFRKILYRGGVNI